MSYQTLAEREQEAVARMRSALARLTEDLAAYAALNGGTFTLFGSAARGDLRARSDVDILVEFPAEAERAAELHAEARCRDLGLVPDIQLHAYAGERLRDRVAREGRVLR